MKYNIIHYLFLLSILFCQEEIVHISKIYPDGKPKEILIYERKNDDLKSMNSLILIEKINYDRNGNYIKPKVSGLERKVKQMVVGKWGRENRESKGYYVEFVRNGRFIIYEDFEIDNSESGFWDVRLKEDKSILVLSDEKKSEREEIEIRFPNRDVLITDSDRVFYRMK